MDWQNEATTELEPGPVSSGIARAFVGSSLRAWGHAELADDAGSAAGALVADAVVRGRTPVALRIRHHEGRVRVEVTDQASATLVPGGRVSVSDRRGLSSLAAAARRLGIDAARGRTTVWCELDAVAAAAG